MTIEAILPISVNSYAQCDRCAENEVVAKRTQKPAPKSGRRPIEPIYACIGKVVRDFRENRAMSIQQLANAVGMSRSQMSRLESGQCRIMLHDVARIANALSIHPEELLHEWFESVTIE